MVTTQKIFQPPVEGVLAELKNKFEQYPYPDAGVRWEAYYKRQLSGQKYEIKPQTPYRKIIYANTADALLTPYPTFITTISLWYSLAGLGSGDDLQLGDGNINSGNVQFEKRIINGTYGEFVWVFPRPLIFLQGIYLDNGATSGTGTMRFELWGWQEIE